MITEEEAEAARKAVEKELEDKDTVQGVGLAKDPENQDDYAVIVYTDTFVEEGFPVTKDGVRVLYENIGILEG